MVYSGAKGERPWTRNAAAVFLNTGFQGPKSFMEFILKKAITQGTCQMRDGKGKHLLLAHMLPSDTFSLWDGGS